MATPSLLISVVVPLLNEAECLPKVHEELRRVCDPLPYRFEFIFVDDGSTDGSAEVLDGLRRGDPRVRSLVLSRNFGHQAALSAGLAHARGDGVITMDCDMQHPPALIPELIDRWRAGDDVVNTIRKESVEAGLLKRLASAGFYRFFNWATRVPLEAGSADFRLMGRPVVDVLNALPERQRFLRGLVPWLGFRQGRFEYEAPRRFAGRPKYSFSRSLRLAADGLTSFSFYPLRLSALMGCAIIGLSFLYGIYALAMHLIAQTTQPGWTSLIVCVLFLGGCQIAILGVLGEYIGRILEQVKERPLYIVKRIGDDAERPSFQDGQRRAG